MANVAKSFEAPADPVIAYITQLSTRQETEVQRELQRATLAHAERAGMLGAPEGSRTPKFGRDLGGDMYVECQVLDLGKTLIHLIHGKRVLDIGTFTGASALAWALVIPSDGRVVSMDVSHEELDKVGRPILAKHPDLLKKIEFRLGAALETLDNLIAAGESGTYDFAFIDADKENYTNYYERTLTLLRPGGVIAVDNALFDGTVVTPTESRSIGIDAMNRHAADDGRTLNSLLNIGDGVHFIVKKH